jgi:CHAT domain-containing protein
VLPELDAVVHDPAVPASHGAMGGKLLANDQFTYSALKTELGAGENYSVVHIASHFVALTAGGVEPYLLLSGDTTASEDGYELTLSKMQEPSINLEGTRLLTLSACSTAKDYKTQNGVEMDSLGMVAQQKDAQAVLAALWDVNDASTSQLMSAFYTRWIQHARDGKGEALRQTQLAMLHRTATGPSGYSHPFYWAPFVLIGNYE